MTFTTRELFRLHCLAPQTSLRNGKKTVSSRPVIGDRTVSLRRELAFILDVSASGGWSG
jgi:hypothetical protein